MLRIGSAPISWGICEVPGWGRMLPTERVLSEMRELGLYATELGAPGFFPDDAGEVRALLDDTGMQMLGGFVPVVLHDPAFREQSLADSLRIAKHFQQLGAEYFVTAVVMSPDWAPRRRLDAAEWSHLVGMLDEIEQICDDHGLMQVLHPHWNTAIEQAEDFDRLLDSSPVRWCLDTGHMALGGADPVEFAARARDRITYVHLKDVRLAQAVSLQAGTQSIMGAVQEGMFCPLGSGDVPIGEVVTSLVGSGYDGWFVIEQDTAITGGDPELGSGPILDVRESVEYLRSLGVGQA